MLPMPQDTARPQPGTPRAQFGSRTGFILAAAGSAVGLGNIWRFPFVTGQNGGGAFLLPYVIALLAIGVPVLIIELSAGRAGMRGIVGTLAQAGRQSKWLGLVVALATLVLLSYYLVVTGWAIGYFVYGLGNSHPRFAEFSSGANSVWFLLAGLGITVAVVRLGVNRGIERTSKLLMPALLVVLTGLAFYSLTLPGFGDAMSFYLQPRFGALADARVWIVALGQVFFSVGVGMGVMVTYGSYMSREIDVERSAIIIALSDSGIALLAGIVIFPIVFSFGGEPGAGPSLAFDTLPIVFGQFQPAVGYTLAALFYLSLSVAAITSAISLLETVVVAAGDATGIDRGKGLWVGAAAVLLLGLPSALSYSGWSWEMFGQPVLDIVDTVVGNIFLPLGVLFTAVPLLWFAPRLIAAGIGRVRRRERLAMAIVKWAVPVVVLVLLSFMLAEALTGSLVPETGG
jgi:NSS family neurotransmitter:Na+ symporter